ncbi:T-cell immunoreceptor with Ig and ITIM domains [Ctenodactylus gundi]
MHWCLVLIWAQGLRQATLLASEAMAGAILTQENISAQEGDSVILQCHFSFTTAEVTQVNWKRQDQTLAVCHSDLGWHVNPAFREQVSSGPRWGLTFRSVTTNDTGEYFCVYHTYPDGVYKKRIFLEVLGHSASEPRTRFQTLLLGAIATAVGVICVAVIVITVAALARKTKSLRIHSMASGLRRTQVEQQESGPGMPSPHGRCLQAEAAPAGLCGGQSGNDDTESHEYFNVLSYRSLGSFSFLAETG